MVWQRVAGFISFRATKMESSKSLFKLVNGLRFFGVGTRVKRSNFNFPNSYWVLTRVKLSPDQKHGKAYGKLVWRGKARAEEEEIRSPLKKQWSIVGLPDYKTFNATAEDLAKIVSESEVPSA